MTYVFDIENIAKQTGQKAEDVSRIIQEQLFEGGTGWACGDKTLRKLDAPFLFYSPKDGVIKFGDYVNPAYQYISATLEPHWEINLYPFIEFEGKKYNRVDFHKAIAGLAGLACC